MQAADGKVGLPVRGRGGAKARGMVLRWALLKAMGPDRWHYHGMLNEARFVAFRDALSRAIQSRPGGCSVADLGAGHGLLASAGRCACVRARAPRDAESSRRQPRRSVQRL